MSQPEITKNSRKHLILEVQVKAFKVVDVDKIKKPMDLYATVFTLEEPIATK